ncbi:class I adenylate-forming enzyme family protein [Mycolicibacterium sp. OfavD-34-C]|uniref:class I adenylate-forming enzyme family protein n=1 Tax=Mycolicibacterium sp. OfavD-34-C TaxID=2917746 RepID=UPI001EF484FC|nr:class I adenylate-forming enzyme family protein [Mycolicibacterium sp. OfavD-34-C]MCG7579750.1 acyl--CoA ligase [Mycolicibacterium sp. OfavD-34-C]
MADTIDALLRDAAHRHATKDAVVEPGTRLTYRELDIQTLELAAAFLDAGINKGCRVGLLMPNGVQWARIAFALTRVGAVLVPLSTLFTPPELSAALRTAAVQHLIAVDEFRGRRYLDDLPPAGDLPALRTVHRTAALPAEGGGAAHRVADVLARTVRPADPLAILFTSGSSGAPKGVRHSHGNAIDAVRSGLAARRVDADTRLYLPMPFFWVGGFAGGLMSALVAGATLVTEAVPEPDSTLRLLTAEGVTLFRGWPDQAEALARHRDQAGAAPADLSALKPGSLEALLPEGERSRPGSRARLFGMTESFGPYCGYPADTDMPESAWGSCGKPFDGMTVRVVDPDTGTPVSTGEAGMIQIRGPHVMQGICRRSREEVFTADGYYPTGDLGHLDADGFLFFDGRADDMFKVSGATVYPSEVERALRGLTGVRAAFVTNVAGPAGERIGAAVVCDAPTTVADLGAAARAVLSPFKVPTVWALLDDEDAVPRGATGKVDAARLRAMLLLR